MKHMSGRKRHSAEDIVRKLRRAEELATAGKTGEEVAAELEVSAATSRPPAGSQWFTSSRKDSPRSVSRSVCTAPLAYRARPTPLSFKPRGTTAFETGLGMQFAMMSPVAAARQGYSA